MRVLMVLLLFVVSLSGFAEPLPDEASAGQGRLLGVNIFSLWSRNPRKAFEWYRDVLGLKVHDDGEFQPGDPWMTLNVPGHPEILIAFKKGEPRPGQVIGTSGPVFNTVLGLETNDLRALSDRLKAKGVVFRLPPQEFPYGAMAVIEDLDGQVIALTEPKKPK